MRETVQIAESVSNGAEEPKPCAVCDGSTVSTKMWRFGYRIVQCDTCGLVYLDLRVTPKDLRDFYDAPYFTGGKDRRGYADYVGDRETSRKSFRHKLMKIEELKAPGRLLDIGCATGFFLEEASDRGWKVSGQEVSEYAGGIARQTFGDSITVGTLNDVDLPAGSLDVVTMWDVIEHIDDPMEALAQVRGWLKPDGLFVVCTGNIDSWLARLQGSRSRIYNPPQHLYYYSDTSLSELLRRGGFEVVRRENDWKTMSVEYFLYVLACLNPNPLSRALQQRASASGLGKRSIRIPLVDNLKIYAKPT